ncbi:MAG: hypothetical protein JXM69_09945 [Anaerolineae bacterium]|nr:hypothetical protein [Anaerolineae bacterium]
MKKFLSITGTVFAISLAIVMGIRMSPDAMAVVIGIICGVLASIPTSTLLVWVMRQREKQLETQSGQSRYFNQFPPVVVVNGQGPNGYHNGTYAPPLPAGPISPGSRNFKVIGQENTETTGDILPPFWEDL